VLGTKIGFILTNARDFLASILMRSRVNPNFLTFSGLFISAAAAYFLGTGHLMTGGVLALIGGIFDTLDGAVARASQRISKFGGFLDSVIDRYSDFLLFFGILFHFFDKGHYSYLVITMIGAFGSFLTSYARARAENVIDGCKVGYMERPERVILITLGAMTNRLGPAMVIMALFTNLCVLSRILHTHRHATSHPVPDNPEPAVGPWRAALRDVVLWRFDRMAWQHTVLSILLALLLLLSPAGG